MFEDVRVGVAVAVDVCVLDLVVVGDIVGVRVGVRVTLGVRVRVADAVGLGVGCIVGVREGLRVNVGVVVANTVPNGDGVKVATRTTICAVGPMTPPLSTTCAVRMASPGGNIELLAT